jgi:hypothetical protein
MSHIKVLQEKSVITPHDSATDIVEMLVSKGVITEEEGKLLTKAGRTSDRSYI